MSLSVEQAARRLGMKTAEVVSVEEIDGAHLVATHDGQRVWVTEDAVLPYVAPPVPVLVDPLGPEPEVAAEGGELVGVDPVPEGPTATVLEWVGDDAERAGRALAAELSATTPRKGLVEALEKLVTP
ncbi:MAG: hypothetical protein JWR37_1207 [Mycobacterium sp.]|nr:hypothetical protein [Mycobacterium sp.]